MERTLPYPVRMARPITKEKRFEMRLSPAAESILEQLKSADGLPFAYIVEAALRDYADARGVKYPGSDIHTARRPPLLTETPGNQPSTEE